MAARESRRVCRPASGGLGHHQQQQHDDEDHAHSSSRSHALGNAMSALSGTLPEAQHCRRRPCVLTRGSWCQGFEAQQPVAWLAPPLGAKDCPSTQWGMCNNVGSCQHATGICQCPAGWKGLDCGEPDKRPCTNRRRGALDPKDVPASHIGPDGMDLDMYAPGWTASRCAGWCDEDTALCYCPPGTKFGRVPPPPGSPPGTPPLRKGRPIAIHCSPSTGPNGTKTSFGGRPGWNDTFGPQGWCNMPEGQFSNAICPCPYEGQVGMWCEEEVEAACPNQCSGRGRCIGGFCKCDPGWYGTECGAPRAGTQLDDAAAAGNVSQTPALERPWLKLVAGPVPAAAQRPPAATRLRPLIYVYDLPPKYNTRMLQYGHGAPSCTWRRFKSKNGSEPWGGVYSLEQYLHEMLLQSEHRTLNPEEADFFYVPVYQGCFMWPVFGWADYPWWHVPWDGIRPMQAMYMWLEVKQWLQANFPYWDRHGGRDHIWLAPHDEGACYMPSEIYSTSVVLTHWGRLDAEHASNTAYFMDNYDLEFPRPGEPVLVSMARMYQPEDWRRHFKDHPCYDPNKDLVVPSFKDPSHYRNSTLQGALPLARDVLLFFRGDVGEVRAPRYSRGLRQKLASLAKEGRWAQHHNIWITKTSELHGSYSEQLARSLFCLVLPGDGWSARAEDAVLHGCIPVVIMDRVHAVFESILDWDAFSVRLPEAAVNEHLPELLKAISPDRILRMQHNLAGVMHRFAYAHGPLIEQMLEATRAASAHLLRLPQLEVPQHHPFQPLRRFPRRQDALATILQWLHGRMLAMGLRQQQQHKQ